MLGSDVGGLHFYSVIILVTLGLTIGPVVVGALGGWLGGSIMRGGKVSSALWTGIRIGGLVGVVAFVFFLGVFNNGSEWVSGSGALNLLLFYLFLVFLLAAAYTHATRPPKESDHY